MLSVPPTWPFTICLPKLAFYSCFMAELRNMSGAACNVQVTRRALLMQAELHRSMIINMFLRPEGISLGTSAWKHRKSTASMRNSTTFCLSFTIN